MEEDEARYYDERFRQGGVLLTVRADDGRYDEARTILERRGGDVRRTAGASTATVATAPTGTTSATGRWEDEMPRYRTSWEQRYGTGGGTWAEYEPRYRYGWEMRNDPRYRGRSWTEVEPDLRRDWETRHRDMPWDRAGEAVREAWEGVTGRR